MQNLVMTVAQWYQTYSTPEYRESYIVLPKHALRKNKANSKPYAFSVEIYINIGQVISRCFLPSPFVAVIDVLCSI